MRLPMATSRRDLEVHSLPWLVLLLVPVAAIALQATLPVYFPRIAVFDLPLLVVIYFAIARRGPIYGTLVGMVIGMLQDALTNMPIGVTGISKSLIGFIAASISVRIDVENDGTRFFMNFVFSLLATGLDLLIRHRLLGIDVQWDWVHELIRAVVNAVLAVLLFALLDRTRRMD